MDLCLRNVFKQLHVQMAIPDLMWFYKWNMVAKDRMRHSERDSLRLSG